MKQVLRLTTIAALMTLGLASQAQALTSLQLIACQGSVCAATPVTVGSTISIVAPVVVGDFTVNAQGGSTETGLVSNAQETSISVERTGITNNTALDVYLVATNYVLPVAPNFIDSTHGATFTDNPLPASNNASAVSFIGWFNDANTGLTGVPAGGGAFNTGVGLPAGLQTNGSISCLPLPGSPRSCNVDGTAAPISGTAPFSLITRTTFNVPFNGQFDTYTSNSQVVVGVASVPDGASTLSLLGLSLMGIAVARRRFAL